MYNSNLWLEFSPFFFRCKPNQLFKQSGFRICDQQGNRCHNMFFQIYESSVAEGKITRHSTSEEIVTLIKEIQYYAVLQNTLSKRSVFYVLVEQFWPRIEFGTICRLLSQCNLFFIFDFCKKKYIVKTIDRLLEICLICLHCKLSLPGEIGSHCLVILCSIKQLSHDLERWKVNSLKQHSTHLTLLTLHGIPSTLSSLPRDTRTSLQYSYLLRGSK